MNLCVREDWKFEFVIGTIEGCYKQTELLFPSNPDPHNHIEFGLITTLFGQRLRLLTG